MQEYRLTPAFSLLPQAGMLRWAFPVMMGIVLLNALAAALRLLGYE